MERVGTGLDVGPLRGVHRRLTDAAAAVLSSFSSTTQTRFRFEPRSCLRLGRTTAPARHDELSQPCALGPTADIETPRLGGCYRRCAADVDADETKGSNGSNFAGRTPSRNDRCESKPLPATIWEGRESCFECEHLERHCDQESPLSKPSAQSLWAEA